MHWVLWVIIPPVWYMVLGTLLMACFRGRVNPHASCGRCQYAIAEGNALSARCPECGSEYALVGIRPAREPRSNVAWGVGLALVVIGLLGVVVLLPGLPRTIDSTVTVLWVNLVLMPVGSIATGIVLLPAARLLGRRKPACMACGHGVEDALGAGAVCSRCGRSLVQAGVRGRRGPGRSTVLLGVATVVLGLTVTMCWIYLSAHIIGVPE